MSDTEVKSQNHLFKSIPWSIMLLGIIALSAVIDAGAVENRAKPAAKLTVKSLYIPLADHYAALVAYERYRHEMVHADFQIQQMKNWDLLRGYFQTGEAEMAFVMSPLAMDMYAENPHFRWIGLMHRDGNALAINDVLNNDVQLPISRSQRKPDEKVANALAKSFKETQQPVQIGMPHLLSTHTVVLYRYLKEHGIRLALQANIDAEVLAIAVPPPKSPAFIKGRSNRALAAAFEQSLPWAEVVESISAGRVAWYSKDVMKRDKGHVECIALATDKAIENKTAAVKEVMKYIQKAGRDIEDAREAGGQKLNDIVNIVQKYIPAHSRDSIIASLNPDLNVISYKHLSVDKAGLKQIMDFALEGGILKKAIDIDEFADTRFLSEKISNIGN